MKISEYKQLISEGKYKKIHKIIDDELSLGPSREKCVFKIAVFLYENKYEEAIKFVHSYERYLTNYAKGIVYYKAKRYDEAIKLLEKTLDSKDISKKRKISASLVLINSYLFNPFFNKREVFYREKIFKLIDDLKMLSTKNESEKLFDEQPHLYLIEFFLNRNELLKDNLIKYFTKSKDEIFKGFNDIIRYSFALKYTPEELIPYFLKSEFVAEDKYFCFLCNKNNVSEKEKVSLKKIWFWEYLILTQLIMTEYSWVNEISHYTSFDVFKAMAESKEKSYLRLVSLANANDKVEGNVLSSIFSIRPTNSLIIDKEDNQYIAIQTSYSRNKNSLTMFRLYGKKENKENKENKKGMGVSLVFNKNFFLTDFSSIQPEAILRSQKTNKDPRKPLVWVLYYNKNKKIFYYYPNKDDLDPTKISLNICKVKWNSYPNSIDKQKEKNLEYSFHKLISEVNSLKTNKMQKLAMNVLYGLRYYIKFSDFAEEKELRVLTLINPLAEEIHKEENKPYANYLDIWSYDSLKSIIFGPKVSSTSYEHYKKIVLEQHPDILIEISDAPWA